MKKPFIIGENEDRPSVRPLRYAQRIKEELALLIPGELKDPKFHDDTLFITITNVSVSPDLKNATVQFSMMGERSEGKEKEIQTALNQAATFLRRELMQSLDTKITPHLTFKYDRGSEHSSRVLELLDSIRK